MKIKKVLPVLISVIILVTLICNLPVEASKLDPANVITVPQDYNTIQEAIDAAAQGDIIYVCSGNYCEPITIDKSNLKIVGEDKRYTIIDLGGTNLIMITAENTWLQGFTIRNTNAHYALNIQSDGNVVYDNIFESNYGGICCGFSLGYPKVSDNFIVANEIRDSLQCGVYLCSACGNIISGNNLSTNNWAITLYKSSASNIISRNAILNTKGICINLSNSTRNIVSNNYLNSAGTTGIYVDYHSDYNDISRNTLVNIDGIWGIIYVINSFYNTITNNVLINNSAGIYLDHASGEIISNNIMKGNRYGIGVNGDQLSHFIHTIDDSNRVNGKPIYYIVNQEKITVDSNICPELGFLAIINSTGIKVKNLEIAGNWHGIMLAYTTNSKIENVTVSNNFSGIDLSSSSNNTITGSTISNNNYGIRFMSSESSIYKNNFLNNSHQVQCSSQNPTWDNGAEGNFWDDYAGEDENEDGIGDDPFIINESNCDYFPLINPMDPSRTFYAGTWNQTTYYVTVCSNSTIAGFNFNQTAKQISFNVTGPSGETGFCNVTIPKDLLNGDYVVRISSSITDFSSVSNDTHNFLYCLYNCTSKNVKIIGTTVIPEFAIMPIFPVFVLLTCLLVLLKPRFGKRKFRKLQRIVK